MTRRAWHWVIVFIIVVTSAPWAMAGSPTYEYRMTSYSWFGQSWYKTTFDLCTAFAEARNAQDSPAGSRSCSKATATEIYLSNGVSYTIEGARAICPGGVSPDTSKPVDAQCPDGGGSGGSVPSVPSCKAGDVGHWNFDTTTGVPPLSGISDGTCEIDITGVEECYERKDKTSYCTYTTKKTGNKKAPGTEGSPSSPSTPGSGDSRSPVPPISNPPDSKCPSGTVQGGIDSGGIPICIGMGTTPNNPSPKPPVTTGPTVTVNNPDGSTTTKTTTTTANSDGSTTTVTQTSVTGAGGGTTTSTTRDTSKTPSGATGKDESKEAEDKNDLCTKNPTLNVCKNSSVSGSCEQTTCSGDAIQCATLRAAATMECREKKDRDLASGSSIGQLGQSLADGNDPLASSLPSSKNAAVVDVPGTLDTSGFAGGGSFFTDTTVTVQGRDITIPFSKAESALIAFRYAMMLVASLACFKIIRTAVLS
jgi:hypothetical protein